MSKYTTTAGPRQTKAVSGALSAISWESKTYLTLMGVKGAEESKAVMTSPFGKPRPEADTILERIGEKYAWTITRDNHKAILSDLVSGLEELKESRPTVDSRMTPEDVTQLDKDRAERQEKAKKKRAIEAAENTESEKKWAEEYPYLEQVKDSKKSSHALAASNIRAELKRKFAGHKFRVESDSYSMGDSIHVRWTDGPTQEEVEVTTNKYSSASMNLMEDMKEYHGTYWHKIFSDVDFVFEERTISEERREEVRSRMPDGHDRNQLECKLRETSWYVKPEKAEKPAGSETKSVDGVEVTENTEQNGVEIRFQDRPERGVLDGLKANGWRWSRFNKCWYHKKSD